MFSLGIRYLMGWAMAAADGARKERAEWPPHPDRVFMALAAAWFETGQDAAEGDVLRWLEGLPAPGLCATGHTQRQLVTHFVPVNDAGLSTAKTIASLTANVAASLGGLKDAGLSQLPEFRSRQPRAFPVAIPHDPVVHLRWEVEIPEPLREPLSALCCKVSSVGHSASLVQVWVEQEPPEPTLTPVPGVAPHRLRLFSPGRLAYLEQRLNREAWLDFHDRKAAIEAASRKEPDLYTPPHPQRFAWGSFPDALLLAGESEVKQHPAYAAAKSGNAEAAAHLVQDLVSPAGIKGALVLIAGVCREGAPILASAHAYEREGVNAIPAALAELLSERLGIPFESSIVQTNVVSHTGSDGYGRLARQAAFDGPVEPGREYILVDDFVGQGGTLANLRGHIQAAGGLVVAAIALTGKPYSATLAPTQEQLDELRQRHGKPFEKWWSKHFGHPFDHLTQSEARYLARSPDADTIRDRLAAAEQGGSGPGHPGSSGRRYSLKELKAEQAARYPNGTPTSLRPEPGLWQGYAAPADLAKIPPASGVFDLRLIILALSGKRLPLNAALKLTEALRGALLKACPEPIPEWVSGHGADSRASSQPHVAFLPLPFVGNEHGDGRIMGMALALPKHLDPDEVARVLEPWLRDEDGQPKPLRLFDGQWLECGAELETRELPPHSLRPEIWTGPARRWASVTPVVLDRHFDGPDKWKQAAESVKTACERAGLPRPLEVLLHPVSLHAGVPRSGEFPWMTRKKDGGRMHHAHALIVFGEEVQGPVLVGAGRFRGYGLCRPLKQGGEDHA